VGDGHDGVSDVAAGDEHDDMSEVATRAVGLGPKLDEADAEFTAENSSYLKQSDEMADYASLEAEVSSAHVGDDCL
jgi:hypothetical protein